MFEQCRAAIEKQLRRRFDALRGIHLGQCSDKPHGISTTVRESGARLGGYQVLLRNATQVTERDCEFVAYAWVLRLVIGSLEFDIGSRVVSQYQGGQSELPVRIGATYQRNNLRLGFLSLTAS